MNIIYVKTENFPKTNTVLNLLDVSLQSKPNLKGMFQPSLSSQIHLWELLSNSDTLKSKWIFKKIQMSMHCLLKLSKWEKPSESADFSQAAHFQPSSDSQPMF